VKPLAVRGFALSSAAHAEADKLAWFYTLQLGRIRVLAKGARKPRSRTASALELFTESSFHLYKKASGDLYLLGQAKVLEDHGGLKRDLASITALQVLADLLVQALSGSEPHPEVYGLVKRILEAWESGTAGPEIHLCAFILRFLDLSGYPLELSACAECGSDFGKEGAWMVPHRGGALCRDCFPSGPARAAVSPAGREVLKKLRTLPVEKLSILKLRPEFIRGLLFVLLDYLERTLEKPLRSVDFYLKIADHPK
jgi:DNA repair protein RecO (recombination protein O)